jgi:thiopeptide-type bacteriocin biosynthesis protein
MKKVQQTFIPGSSWIYIKLYAGNKTADDLLIQTIFPIIKELKKKQYIEKWFFIRYSDPDFHLRIRLLVTEIQHVGAVINSFYKKLNRWNQNRTLWKMQLDTYNRELERYGSSLIEDAESLFYIDSECILSILKQISNNENYRWMIALKLIDSLLSDFNVAISNKRQLMESVSKSYKMEFGFNEYNSKQFNSKFRENKVLIESVLENTAKDELFSALYMPVKKRSKRLIPVIEQINFKLKKEKINIEDLLKSYIHMMMNRLFRSKNRVHELILYDFMRRYYISEIARQKYYSDK